MADDSFDLDYDDDCEDADLYCPPLLSGNPGALIIVSDDDLRGGCTCPCHRLRPTLAETITGYVMLFGFAALCLWLLHMLACS